MASNFLAGYKGQRFILYYEQSITAFQALQLNTLHNQVSFISKGKEGKYALIDLPRKKDLKLTKGYRLVFIDNATLRIKSSHASQV